VVAGVAAADADPAEGRVARVFRGKGAGHLRVADEAAMPADATGSSVGREASRRMRAL
jgi:hypothetical protein